MLGKEEGGFSTWMAGSSKNPFKMLAKILIIRGFAFDDEFNPSFAAAV